MTYLLSDYNFELPEDLIAQEPGETRDGSRLLHLNRGCGDVSHGEFCDIEKHLKPGDLLVVNNTRVIPGRLYGRKETGGKIEILILDYLGGLRSLDESGVFRCDCLVKASKRPKNGSTLYFEEGLSAVVEDFSDGVYSLSFHCDGDVSQIVEKVGSMPLPPYIKREGEAPCDDKSRYQTVYAKESGAIAAPTAGLHFTEDLMARLREKGVDTAEVTLHVGYGTFLPVRVEDIRDHRMHSEWFQISDETAGKILETKSRGGRVIAVGTTSVRTLEYVSHTRGGICACSGECDMFIYPGYEFKTVDGMITNFHLPESTLLMLISAFAGREAVMSAYEKAVAERYRFFSYGDAMLIL